MKKIKVLYVSGTRADYGLMKHSLNMFVKNGIDVEIVATGMHLMDEFGSTIKEIEEDRFIVHKVNALYENDYKQSMSKFLGNFIVTFTDVLKKVNPDLILLLGDRAEMLGAAATGTYLSIPIAHIHGGDVSGHVDDPVRHAITKLSHIHFPVTKKSSERIIKMGENPSRVYIVGAPGLDSIVNRKSVSKEILFRKYNLDIAKKTVIVLQHPVSIEFNQSDIHIKSTMDAVSEFCKNNNTQAVVIHPNADSGGREMISVIDDYTNSSMKIFKNIFREDFLDLMKYSDVMVGNSSSGIIEAACFKLPVVNIGTRQEGRERSSNIIDADYEKTNIYQSISKAIYDKKFRKSLSKCKNLYGDGKSGSRMANVLKKINVDQKLIQKKLTY